MRAGAVVLFDLDGTVLDTEGRIKTAWDQTLADHGIRYTWPGASGDSSRPRFALYCLGTRHWLGVLVRRCVRSRNGFEPAAVGMNHPVNNPLKSL